MAKKKSVYVKYMTPPFRASFPALHEPKLGPDGTGKPKYSVRMMFPKEAESKDKEMLAKIRASVKDSALKYWDGKIPVNLKKPFKDGDTESDHDGDKGYMIASARTDKKPGVVDARNIPIESPEAIQEKIYPGCWCRATILVGATETGGSKCVHFILQNLQKLKDGERFDNRVAATEEFEPVEFSEEQEDFADEKDGF